jgi:hypothetical protein
MEAWMNVKSLFASMHPALRVGLRVLAVIVIHNTPLWLVWMGQAHCGGPWPRWELEQVYFWIDLPVSFWVSNGSSWYAVHLAYLFQFGGLEWIVIVLLANAIWYKKWYLALIGLYGVNLLVCGILFLVFVLPWLG